MASFTLYRCDHCGQTRDSKTGFVAAQIASQRLPLPNSYLDQHPSLRLEVCSMDCFIGWANAKSRDEFAQLTAESSKPKKKR